MKLTYRGANYEMIDSPLDAASMGAIGQYRGAPTLIHTPLIIVRPERAIGLQYRGAAYLKLS